MISGISNWTPIYTGGLKRNKKLKLYGHKRILQIKPIIVHSANTLMKLRAMSVYHPFTLKKNRLKATNDTSCLMDIIAR